MEDKDKEVRAQEIFLKFMVDGKFSIYRRSILLMVLAGFILFFGNTMMQSGEPNLIRLFISLTIAILSPIAFNLFVLIPKFLFKGRYFLYFLLVNLCITFFYLALMLFLWFWWPTVGIDPKTLPQSAIWTGALTFIIILNILCAATAGVRFFQRLIKDNYRIVKLENSLILVELDLLKTLISPHFLLNMLNNSEVLVQTNPLKARQIIMKLSHFLRYLLYDSNREKVLLQADIRFLEHFLAMEKIRRDFFEFEIVEEGTERQIEVSPLLFIPFVENAVKHNIHSGSGGFVKLSFTLNEHELVFVCINPVSNEKPTESGGLGLPNVKRRLELLYPDKFTLITDDKNGFFKATLTISI